MTDTTKPTGKQLRYLRQLADRTGQTFTYPKTGRQASDEIKRLKAQTRSSHTERRRERHEIADASASGPKRGAAIREDHTTTGYGSTATWR